MHRRRFLGLAAGSFATGGCLDFSSWTNQQDSPISGTGTPTDGEGSSLVRWQAEIGKRVPVPAVEGESVYAVGSTSGVHAFAADDGTRRWRRSSPQSAWFGPTIGDGAVYAVGYQTLVAYDTGSGEERWQRKWSDEAAMEASAVVGENAVFAGLSSLPTSHTDSKFPEDLWAFDRRDGTLLWKRDLSGGTETSTGGPLSGRPVFNRGMLYAQTQGGTVIALDPSDGSDRWRHQRDGTTDAGGPTLVVDQELLVVPLDLRSDERGQRGALVGLATDDGRERWRVDGIQTAPVSDGTTVYGAEIADVGEKSTVFALSAADGSEKWKFTKPGPLKTWSSLSAAGGTLFASFTERTGRGDVKDDDSTLYAVGMDGTEQWRFERSCEGFSQAVVSEGTVYVAGRYGDGTLYALTPKT